MWTPPAQCRRDNTRGGWVVVLPGGAGIPGHPTQDHQRTHARSYALRIASQIARAGRSDRLLQEWGCDVRKWIESPSWRW
jgi:hypothetical protein